MPFHETMFDRQATLRHNSQLIQVKYHRAPSFSLPRLLPNPIIASYSIVEPQQGLIPLFAQEGLKAFLSDR